MFLYRDILSQSWKNTWRNKYLWFFGLFAALLGGWGDLEIVFRGFNNSEQGSFYGLERLASTILSKDIFSNVGKISSSSDSGALFMSFFVILIFVIVALFLVFLTIVSQTALVHNTTKLITKKKHDIKSGLEMGIKRFWPVFGFNLLLKFILYGIFSLLSVFIVTNAAENGLLGANIYPILLFIIFIPLAIVLSFIIKYAICYSVIKGERFIDSLTLSWGLFIKNWLVSLEMAFILFFISFLYALGLMLFFLVLSVPFVFITVALAKLTLIVNIWLIIVSALFLFLFIVIISGAVLAAFQISSWTSLFLELISRGGTSKITRLFNK